MNLNDETVNAAESKQMNLTDTSFHFKFQITDFLLAYSRSGEFLLSWQLVLNFMSMLLKV